MRILLAVGATAALLFGCTSLPTPTPDSVARPQDPVDAVFFDVDEVIARDGVAAAIAKIHEADEKTRAEGDVQRLLASLYLADGQVDRAERTFQVLAAQDASDSDARLMLARIAEGRAEYDVAWEYLQEVYALIPDDGEVLSAMGGISVHRNDYEAASQWVYTCPRE